MTGRKRRVPSNSAELDGVEEFHQPTSSPRGSSPSSRRLSAFANNKTIIALPIRDVLAPPRLGATG